MDAHLGCYREEEAHNLPGRVGIAGVRTARRTAGDAAPVPQLTRVRYVQERARDRVGSPRPRRPRPRLLLLQGVRRPRGDQIDKLGRCWKCNGRGHWPSARPVRHRLRTGVLPNAAPAARPAGTDDRPTTSASRQPPPLSSAVAPRLRRRPWPSPTRPSGRVAATATCAHPRPPPSPASPRTRTRKHDPPAGRTRTGEAGPSAAGAIFPTTVYEQATWIDGVRVDKINNTSQWL